MTPIPAHLRNVFADADGQAIDSWWAALSDDSRTEVARLCDERAESCFFGVVADDRDHVVPKVRGGRFLANDDDAWGFGEWGLSYFEHLLGHPELVLVWDPTERTFHTGCTQHPLARACWAAGTVPADFKCPFFNAGEACLMRPFIGRRIRRRRIGSGEEAGHVRID